MPPSSEEHPRSPSRPAACHHPILERLGFQVIGWEDWPLDRRD
jgi:hypothetical protein